MDLAFRLPVLSGLNHWSGALLGLVKGVVVVCQGGDNAAVSQRIVDAITTALNISSKRVCVTKSN